MLTIISQYLPPDQDEDYIGKENYQDYLADDMPTEIVEESPEESEYRLQISETQKITYSTGYQLSLQGVRNNELVGFNYITRPHKGYPAGVNVGYRIVEPHFIFRARTTNNLLLMSFDRTVGGIRSFIIRNIQPNGIRYKQEKFMPRGDVMVGQPEQSTKIEKRKKQ